MPTYKVGDVVVLKSDSEGDVWMTVIGTTDNESIAVCIWFNKNLEMEERDIPVEALTLINLPE